MRVTFEELMRDYLALRGESPDLLPRLTDGEDVSAVLTLSRELRAKLPSAAVKATLGTPLIFIDEVKETQPEMTLDSRGCIQVRLPDDYLRLYSLRMQDWREPVREPERSDSLRWRLGGNAPEWMCCTEHPMVVEDRDAAGMMLCVYGSEAYDMPATLLYVPFPSFDGNVLTISRASYRRIFDEL